MGGDGQDNNNNDDNNSDSRADDGRGRRVTSLSAYQTHSDLCFGTTGLKSPQIFVYTPPSIKR